MPALFLWGLSPGLLQMTVLAMAEYDYPEYHVATHRAGIDYFISRDQWPGHKLAALLENIMSGQKYV